MLTEENKNFFMAHVLSLVKSDDAASRPRTCWHTLYMFNPVASLLPPTNDSHVPRPPKVTSRSNEGDLEDDETLLTLPM